MATLTDNGCFYTVGLSARDVSTWAESWPCFGNVRPLWFQFDKRNGDLVDMKRAGNIDESALVALSEDAQAWGDLRRQGKPATFPGGLK